MALYVTRPRRDEERIGRGLPSGFVFATAFVDWSLFNRKHLSLVIIVCLSLVKIPSFDWSRKGALCIASGSKISQGVASLVIS